MESYDREMRRVVITGPESSGKTTLALDLALRLNGACAPEVAREFLEELGRPYGEQDLIGIARAQIAAEESMAARHGAKEFLVCDTDLITIRIWSEEKFGRCDPWIIEQTHLRPYDLWLLCTPDMPWEPDPMRENPHDRDRLFDVYARTLTALKKPFVVMRGTHPERILNATAAVSTLSSK